MDGPLGRNRRRKSPLKQRLRRALGLERYEERRLLHGGPFLLGIVEETAAIARPLAVSSALELSASKDHVATESTDTAAKSDQSNEVAPALALANESLALASLLAVPETVVSGPFAEEVVTEIGPPPPTALEAGSSTEVVSEVGEFEEWVLDVPPLANELRIRLPIVEATTPDDPSNHTPAPDVPTLELAIELPVFDAAPVADGPNDSQPDLAATPEDVASEKSAREEFPSSEPANPRSEEADVPADESTPPSSESSASEFGIQLNVRTGLVNLITGGRRSNEETAVAVSANRGTSEVRVGTNISFARTARASSSPRPPLQTEAKVKIERVPRPKTSTDDQADDAPRADNGGAGKPRVLIPPQASNNPGAPPPSKAGDSTLNEANPQDMSSAGGQGLNLGSVIGAALSNTASQSLPPEIEVTVDVSLNNAFGSPHDLYLLQGEGEASPPPVTPPSGNPPVMVPAPATSQPAPSVSGASTPPPAPNSPPAAVGPPPTSTPSAPPTPSSGATPTPGTSTVDASSGASSSLATEFSAQTIVSTPIDASAAPQTASGESASVVIVQLTTVTSPTPPPAQNPSHPTPATHSPNYSSELYDNTSSSSPSSSKTTTVIITVQIVTPRSSGRSGGATSAPASIIVSPQDTLEAATPAATTPRPTAPASDWGALPASPQPSTPPQETPQASDIASEEAAVVDLAEQTTPVTLETAPPEPHPEESPKDDKLPPSTSSPAVQKASSSASEIAIVIAQMATDLAILSLHADAGPAFAWEFMVDLEALDHALNALLVDLQEMTEHVGQFLANAGVSPTAAALTAGVAVAGIVEHGRRRPTSRRPEEDDNWIWQFSDLLGGAPNSLP